VSKHLLDISTVVERDTVGISTKKQKTPKIYEVFNLDELGAFEHAQISRLHQKVRGMVGRTDRKQTPAEKRIVTKALKDILALIVVDLDPHVLQEIDQTQAAKIVAAWAMKYADDGAAEGEDSESPSTTAGSSPSSKSSTAATPRTGSTSRGGS